MPKGKGAKHTTCRYGTVVFITFMDGRQEADIFLERKHRYLFFKRLGRIDRRNIRQFIIKKH